MSIYFINNKRVVELRKKAPDEGHWADYFMDDANDQARPSALRRLCEAESGVLPSPYGEILGKFDLKDKKIVDMGCGIGTYVLALHRQGCDVEGVEYSSRLADQIIGKYPDLKIHCEDATRTHYNDSSVDYALSLGVVEHDESGPHTFLREISRILRPGGFLLVSVPYFNLFWKLRLSMSSPYNPGSLDKDFCNFYQYRFSKKEFAKIVASEGFEVVSWGNTGAMKPLEDAFPFIRKIYSIKGGYRFRQAIIKPLMNLMLFSGHMLWIVAKKK